MQRGVVNEERIPPESNQCDPIELAGAASLPADRPDLPASGVQDEDLVERSIRDGQIAVRGGQSTADIGQLEIGRAHDGRADRGSALYA